MSRSSPGDTVYNFNWDVFGIRKITAPTQDPRPIGALWPCESCWQDSIIETLPPQGKHWRGEFGNAFYIRDIRTLEDDRPLDVQPLFGTAYRDTAGQWVYNGDNFLIGTYVPGDDVRGHAAYIGVPVYWFDHGKIKVLMRKLLEEFGEYPVGS